MNTISNRPCETWAEEISLLAAGLLVADEEHRAREHIESCQSCNREFEQLWRLSQNMAALASAGQFSADSVVARTMDEISSRPRCDANLRKCRPGNAPVAVPGHFSIVCLAAMLVLGIGWSLTGFRTMKLANQPRSAAIPSNGTNDSVVAAASISTTTGVPTLLKLRNAFAQSDEALDSLLAEHAGDILSNSDVSRLLEESL